MVKISPISEESIAEAAEALRAGALIAFPTETVYGLGADATNDRAVAEIFAAKGRPSFNPLIVHLPDRGAAEAFVDLQRNGGPACRPLLAGRADAGPAAPAGLPALASGERRPGHRGHAGAGACRRPAAAARRRRAGRRAQRQPLGPSQPNDRPACGAGSGRPGRAHPRRRPLSDRPGIDGGRRFRRGPGDPAPGRPAAGSDRSRARRPGERSQAPTTMRRGRPAC